MPNTMVAIVQDIFIDYSRRTITNNAFVGETCRRRKNFPQLGEECKTAGKSGITLSNINWVNNDKVEFTVSCSVSNPLVTGAPAIDYEFHCVAENNQYKFLTFYRRHDGFPNYEIWRVAPYVTSPNPSILYSYSHGNKTLRSLFPPMDITVNKRTA